MHGGEFLQTSHLPEAQHSSLSSSEGQMRILSSVVQPATCFLLLCVANDLYPSTVRTKSVSHDDFRSPIALH